MYFRSGNCHVTHLNYLLTTHFDYTLYTLITATVPANMSNYHCSFWLNDLPLLSHSQCIDLFMNIVEILQVHLTNFSFLTFTSSYYYLEGCICNPHLWWTDRFILPAYGVFCRDYHFANNRFYFAYYRFLFGKSFTDFSFANYRFLFHKSYWFSFCFLLQITVINPKHKVKV